MLSRTLTADTVVPPAQRRGAAAAARPWSTSPALAPAGTAAAAGPRSGATFVREPYAQNQKFAQFGMNVHFAQMTRTAPSGGGALGPHSARDPV
jgi:hypothetical protein